MPYYYIYSQYIFISISWNKAKCNQYRLAIRAYSNNLPLALKANQILTQYLLVKC